MYTADNYSKFMRIGLRTLELAFGVIKAKGWKEISIPFFMLFLRPLLFYLFEIIRHLYSHQGTRTRSFTRVYFFVMLCVRVKNLH